MNKSLFVAGLDFGMNEQALKELFGKFGTVVSANIVMDRMTGKSRGFGFVDMSTSEEAQECIKMLNDQDVNGRKVAVRFKEERPSGYNSNRKGF